MSAAGDEIERRRKEHNLPLKEGQPVPWDVWVSQVNYSTKLQQKLLDMQQELSVSKGATKTLARRFDFEHREIHPMETLCAWGQDHPLGTRFHGLSLLGKPGRILVCHECWEEIRGHEATTGS